MSDAHDIIGTRQECWYAPCQVDKVNIMYPFWFLFFCSIGLENLRMSVLDYNERNG